MRPSVQRSGAGWFVISPDLALLRAIAAASSSGLSGAQLVELSIERSTNNYAAGRARVGGVCGVMSYRLPGEYKREECKTQARKGRFRACQRH